MAQASKITTGQHRLCILNVSLLKGLKRVGQLLSSSRPAIQPTLFTICCGFIGNMDYGHPERKQPSLHGQKFTPTPKFLGTAKAYFVCQIGPIFQISLIYVFIGCPQSMLYIHQNTSIKFIFSFAPFPINENINSSVTSCPLIQKGSN